ncbi:hypothetical protein ACIGO9_19995 [Nocardia asteroides]|uniref:hypothetical protein n=1 Tax=Nocardia asteroides TaxID=1824 RepID=UPI0037C4F08D
MIYAAGALHLLFGVFLIVLNMRGFGAGIDDVISTVIEVVFVLHGMVIIGAARVFLDRELAVLGSVVMDAVTIMAGIFALIAGCYVLSHAALGLILAAISVAGISAVVIAVTRMLV